MTTAGKRIRAACTTAMFALVVVGTLFWGDDDFPFGPFRMYSTTTAPTGGAVTITRFEGTTAAGEDIEIDTDQLGLRRAEVLGQVPRIRRAPSLLSSFARAYGSLHPDASPLVELRMIYGTYVLVGGRSARYFERELAAWSRS
jgi:hypothetical protein